jgi:hypothetical protein
MEQSKQQRVEAIRAEIIKLKLEAPYSPKIPKLQQALDRLLQASE